MRERNYSIDLLKIFCAFGVVTIHVPHDTNIAHAFAFFFIPLCVPFFYLSSLFFFITSIDHKDPKKIGANWLHKLFIPYLCWTGLYMMLFGLKYILTHKGHDFSPIGVIFYGASTEHLYFIPKLISIQLLSLAIYYIIRKDSQKRIRGIFFLFIYVVYCIFGIYKEFFSFSLGEFYASFIYVIIIFAYHFRGRVISFGKWSLTIGVVMVALASYWSISGIGPLFFNYSLGFLLGGFGLLLIGLSVKIRKIGKLLKQLADVTYGIYLSHVLLIELWEFFLEKILKKNVVYDLPLKLIETFVIFMICAVGLLYFKRIKFFDRYFLGNQHIDK